MQSTGSTPFMIPARVVLLFATIGAGLSAGFFFTYEASVTLGLAEVGDVAYVETFQAINETIRNPWFGSVFFGTIPLIAAALILSWNPDTTLRLLIVGAALCYIATAVITGVGNVPLNDDLAAYAEITPAIAAEARAEFESEWNQLNLLRTLTALASFVLLAIGLSRQKARGASSGRVSD